MGNLALAIQLRSTGSGLKLDCRLIAATGRNGESLARRPMVATLALWPMVRNCSGLKLGHLSTAGNGNTWSMSQDLDSWLMPVATLAFWPMVRNHS